MVLIDDLIMEVIFENYCDCTKPGDTVMVVGNCASLGNWDPEHAKELVTSADHFPLWYSATIKVGSAVEYKFIVRGFANDYTWEQGNNRTISWDAWTDVITPVVVRTTFNYGNHEGFSSRTSSITTSFQVPRGNKISNRVGSGLCCAIGGSTPLQTDSEVAVRRINSRTARTRKGVLMTLASVVPQPVTRGKDRKGEAISTPRLGNGIRAVRPPVEDRAVEEPEFCSMELEGSADAESGSDQSQCSPLDLFDREQRGELSSYRLKLQAAAAEIAEQFQLATKGSNECLPRLSSLFISRQGSQSELRSLITILFSIASYLQLIAARHIPCVSDGEHYRPCHHARHSLRLFRQFSHRVHAQRLLECPSDVDLDTRNSEVDAVSHVKIAYRLISTYLTSFRPQFTAAVPMTRIRDIAHRNDIPSDLKHEIKVTLQNKLHACAGPEDMDTALDLQSRVHALHNDDLSREFDTFVRELRLFFHAEGTADLLPKLESSCLDIEGLVKDGQQLRIHIDVMRDATKCLMHNSAESTSNLTRAGDLLGIVERVAAARTLLQTLWHEICLRDISKRPQGTADMEYETLEIVTLMEVLQVDIGMENQVFAILSSIEQLIAREKIISSCLPLLVRSISTTLRHVELSGVASNTTAQVRLDLDDWSDRFLVPGQCPDVTGLIFLRSIVEKARYIYEAHCRCLMKLGASHRLLERRGIIQDKRRAAQLVDGHIRTSLAFQLSKMVEQTQKYLTTSLQDGLLDIIMPGTPRGYLVCLRNIIFSDSSPGPLDAGNAEVLISLLSSASRADGAAAVILFVSRIDGDEDLDSLEEDLRRTLERLSAQKGIELNRVMRIVGILCAHSLPSLSHIGVRARALNLPFASLYGTSSPSAVVPRSLVGHYVELNMSGEGAQQVLSTPSTVSAGEQNHKPPTTPPKEKDFEQMTLCRFIEQLAKQEGLKVAEQVFVPLRKVSGYGWPIGVAALQCARTAPDYREVGTAWLALVTGWDGTTELLFPPFLVGKKAATTQLLSQQAQLKQEADQLSVTPSCVALPFGSFENMLHSCEHLIGDSGAVESIRQVNECIKSFHKITCDDLRREWANDLRQRLLVCSQNLPADISKQWAECLTALILSQPSNAHLLPPDSDTSGKWSLTFMARSSGRFEDHHAGKSTAGLYDSFECRADYSYQRCQDGRVSRLFVTEASAASVISSIARVYASLYSDRAVRAMGLYGPEDPPSAMSIMLQPVIMPIRSCFIAHTVSPICIPRTLHHISADPTRWLYAELAVGHGEILANCSVLGRPHAVLIHRSTGQSALIKASSFTISFTPGFKVELTCYREDIMYCAEYRQRVCDIILAASIQLEYSFGGAPQDIEGFITSAIEDAPEGNQESRDEFATSLNVVIVQTREQAVNLIRTDKLSPGGNA